MPYFLGDGSISPAVTIKVSSNIGSLLENTVFSFLAYALPFCRVSLKILSGLYRATVKELFFWICTNQVLKGGASRPRKPLGLLVAAGISAEES